MDPGRRRRGARRRGGRRCPRPGRSPERGAVAPTRCRGCAVRPAGALDGGRSPTRVGGLLRLLRLAARDPRLPDGCTAGGGLRGGSAGGRERDRSDDRRPRPRGWCGWSTAVPEVDDRAFVMAGLTTRRRCVATSGAATGGRWCRLRARARSSGSSSTAASTDLRISGACGGARPWAERSRVRGATAHPGGQLTLGAYVLDVDPEPAVDRSALHLHRVRRRVRDQLVGLIRVDPHHDPALAAGCHRHVAAEEEGQPSEHLLLGQALLVGDELTDPVGEVLVVGHAVSVRTAPAAVRWLPGQAGRRSVEAATVRPSSRGADAAAHVLQPGHRAARRRHPDRAGADGVDRPVAAGVGGVERRRRSASSRRRRASSTSSATRSARCATSPTSRSASTSPRRSCATPASSTS